MAVVSAAMLRPGGGIDHPYYATQRIYDTDGSKSKRWPSRLKINSPSSTKSSDKSPDSPYMYGTISGPGGSALSKSMKYAETWLYGTLRTPVSPMRPSIFTAYPDVPGPVLMTPQKSAPHNYAVILCSCADYLNGTKKSSSTKVSICKKCKGSRLPLTLAEGPRVMIGGTVRGPQTNRESGILRAGTVRVQNSKSRPSILKSQNIESTDPYDLMRRSRLAPPQEARIGSQFSASRARAKSISPSRNRNRKLSPASSSSSRNRSKSVSRINDLWVEENPDYPIDNKRSILTCDVNPYDLLKNRESSKSSVEIEFDDDFNEIFDSNSLSRATTTQHTNLHSSFKAIGGQRIRIADETKTCTVQEVNVYDPINFKNDLKNKDLKTQELCASLSLPNIKSEKPLKKTVSHYTNSMSKKSSTTNSLIVRTKLKTTSPKRPPRKIKTNKTDEDSESDNQREIKKAFEKKPQANLKTARHGIRQNNTIKSILKKPRTSINENGKFEEESISCNSSDDRRSTAHFYLPAPNSDNSFISKHSSVMTRKRVQFLVENEETKIIYTAEFNLTENTVKEDVHSQICTVQNIIEDNSRELITPEITEVAEGATNESQGVYEDVVVNGQMANACINEITDTNSMDSQSEPTEIVTKICQKDDDSNEVPKVVILRRSESERLHSNAATPPKFLDSMALRPKTNKVHTSQVFLGPTNPLCEKRVSNISLNMDNGSTICKIESSSKESIAKEPAHTNIDWSLDAGNLSDNSDFTEEILRNLRRSVSMSPEPPPRLKLPKQTKSRKNNYVKTRFIRSNSTCSTSDEYSDAYDTEQRTVLRVKQFDGESSSCRHSNDFDESYEDCNIEPRRTSILINGDDCYSTMNVTNESPIYLSSVVVNDDYSATTYQSGTTVTISINTPEAIQECSNSHIYIGTPSLEVNTTSLESTENNNTNKSTENKIGPVSEEESHKAMDDSLNISEDVLSILENPVEAVKRNLIPHVCGKSDVINNDTILLHNDCENNNDKSYVNNGFIAKLLDDPLLGHLAEGLDSELVTKLIENSLLRLQESKATNINNLDPSEDAVTKLIESSFIQLKHNEKSEPKSEVAKMKNSEEQMNVENAQSLNKIDTMHSSENEENGCSAPYESMEYESGILGTSSDLEPLSDCYNASASELSTEDDTNSNRSKFYQMLVDAALCEIENANNTDDDHLYESIRLNSDPIYEEICDIPPPLPINPPPSSLLSLDDEKKSGARSIFEGASKYDILSYLVDAKERGIDSEETYVMNYTNESINTTRIEPPKDKAISHERVSSDICSNVSQLSNSSDSSEDNSLVISNEVIEKVQVCKKTSAEIERNDSGVGSETSKCSRSRWQGRTSPTDTLLNKDSPIHLCEDCDTAVETQITESGAMYAPLVCRKCAKKRAERKEIIMEIVETEEKYGRDLQIILEEFYKPMLVAGLLTQEQLSAIFLNVEELIENNQSLSEKMRDALEIAIEQGDEDLLTVNIGKLMVECSHMLAAFQAYCVRQAGAALLLAGLEKEKELLRIFLRVSQMENTVLRRMNLNSFLMVPVQRVTKYPLLLSRLYRATATCASDREDARSAQRSVEARLSEMNAAAAAAAAAARDVPLWRRLAAARRTARDLHVADIRLRKMAVDVLEWNHDDARFAMEGKLLFTQPNDNNWRRGKTIKLTSINALLVTNGKPTESYKPGDVALFPRASGVREAALLLVREKAGRYTLHREPLYLDRCVVAADAEPDHFFEVHEITTKDSFIFKADESSRTRTWYRQLQFHAQGVGAWRKRRNALANIMINPMLTRN